MARFEIARDAGSSLLHSKRVWLIQLVGNALLFALFAGWLLLPVATELHVLLNALAIVALAAAGLILHAGTLNFYSEQSLSERPLVRSAFGRAVKNIFAIAACVGLVFALWALLDLSKSRQLALPFYLRSLLPDFIRVHLAVWWFQIAVEGIVFAIRWIVIPGLILPLVVEAANSGFRAFGKLGFAALRNSVKRAGYWIVLLLAAVAGCVGTGFAFGLDAGIQEPDAAFGSRQPDRAIFGGVHSCGGFVAAGLLNRGALQPCGRHRRR